MAQINVSNLTFGYEGSYDTIFENVSFSIDTRWKLGYHKWIAGGNGTHGTHYYITRGRVGARKREKDAEERNNKITVELQMRKDNRKKETRRQYRRKARK